MSNDIECHPKEYIRGKRGKILTLKEALSIYIKPRMAIHLAAGIGGPSAAIWEIIRTYLGTNPEFTLIESVISGHSVNLIHCGLIKILIFTACILDIAGSIYPSRIIQKAREEKGLELQYWSLLSLQQRLRAGAMGLPFMPARSILVSSMVTDNSEFQEVLDPFGSEIKIGVVEALNPDISIVHGCVADIYGNTILPAPYWEDLWGFFASKNGAIVTVERIVDQDVIKRYSPMVKIPSSIVKAVSLTPLGIHPFSIFQSGLDVFEAYGQDDEFLMELHRAYKDNDLDDWINKWIRDCPNHEDYLNRLVAPRIKALKASGKKDISFGKTPVLSGDNFSHKEASDWTYDRVSMMLIVLAREIVKSVKVNGHRNLLMGLGSGSIAAGLAYYQLRNEGYEVELIAGNGQIGFIPQSGQGIVQNIAILNSAKMLTDTVTTHGVFVGGKNNKCLCVLGAGQIDQYGNLNSTRTSDNRLLINTLNHQLS